MFYSYFFNSFFCTAAGYTHNILKIKILLARVIERNGEAVELHSQLQELGFERIAVVLKPAVFSLYNAI